MVQRPLPLVPSILFLLAAVLGGCLGDDDAPANEELLQAEAPQATERTGSVTGQIITVDLEVLVQTPVILINETFSPRTTQTDLQGRYTFNNLDPGQYRLQVNATCCKGTVRPITVIAGNVTELNLQLERVNPLGLGRPYMVEDVWEGFIGCGFSVGASPSAPCGPVDDNHKVVRLFEVMQGLEELVIAATWDTSGTTVTDSIRIGLRNLNCDGCSETYVKMAGPPPLIAYVNDDDPHRLKGHFANITGSMDMEIKIDAGDNNVVYQQDVTVYWYLFYNQRAPDGFQPLPDA